MNILFPIIKGSEVRQFYHSGVIDFLMQENNNIYIYSDDLAIVEKEIRNDSKEIGFLTGLSYNLPSKNRLSYYKLLLDNNFDYNNPRWKYKEEKSICGFKRLFLRFSNLLLNIESIRSFLEEKERSLKKKYCDVGWKKLLLTPGPPHSGGRASTRSRRSRDSGQAERNRSVRRCGRGRSPGHHAEGLGDKGARHRAAVNSRRSTERRNRRSRLRCRDARVASRRNRRQRGRRCR